MDERELRDLAQAVSGLLRPHLDRSESLRRALSLVGKWLIEESERAAPSVHSPSGQQPATQTPIAPGSLTSTVHPPVAPATPRPEVESKSRLQAPPRTLPMSSAIVPLRIGDTVVHVPLTGTTAELGRARASASETTHEPIYGGTDPAPPPEVDLRLVDERCRLKAASCRLFIERRAAVGDPDRERVAVERLSEMLARAKAMTSCFLWVFWRNQTQPRDASLSRIADSYDALADAASLVRRLDEAAAERSPEDEVSALQLLAEADSALRVALAETWLTEDDRDQIDVHVWLRRQTAFRRVYVERYMTVGDPADPDFAADLRLRIGLLQGRIDRRAAASKQIKNSLGQIKYHARQVVKNAGKSSEVDWDRIRNAVASLAVMGVAATDRRVTEAVGPAAAELWAGDAASNGALAGVLERARSRSASPESEEQDTASADAREWSPLVREVRGLLRGKRLVIIGGDRNASAVERLTEAFELKEAEWVVLTEHGSGAAIRAPIYRADTAVVVVIVKLTGHLHAEEAREYAGAAGKPCVMLSGGYNPERVAMAIVEQASSRLQHDPRADE